ncbi:MAG: hypothetical protein J6X37_06095 [Treponema sp.]|nr:hypothetical protein [Treponema sp.]
MRTTSMIKRFIKTIAVLVSLFVLFSCEVGLGEKVDIYPPSVKVLTPEHTGYILETFTIKGKAHDDSGVSLMTVQIEPLDNPTADTTFKFRISGNKWEYYDNSSATWNDYDPALCSITGSGKDINWELTYTVGNAVQNGTEFVITTQVYDLYGNESKESKDERSVTIDKIDPVVSLISPTVIKPYSTMQTTAATYSLKDNTVLTNLINGEFTISGSQKEEGKLDKLVVYLDARTDSSLDNLEQNALVKKVVTGDNLRNWSTTAKLSEIAGYEHDKKIVRIVTESHDQAGNIETVCQGWFVYWNDADKPWVVANFGGEGDYSHKEVVYPSCTLQGQAYDDDGLSQITVKVFKENNTTPEKTINLDLQGENYPTYKAWSVEALADNCNFRIEAECTDIKGNKSAKETRYMATRDINPPAIKIETDTTKPMIGDANGKINISGYATDDGGISSIKLVRIKNGTPSTTIVKYYSSSYSEWGKATTEDVGITDANGNKIWKLKLTEVNTGDPKLKKKTFSKDFNIFSDFGINGTTEPLNVQNFIIMAEDNGGCANIDGFTYAGDIKAPTLSIEKLYLNGKCDENDGIDFVQANADKKAKMLKPFTRNSAGAITDKIKLTGKWSDNSTDIWSTKTRHSAMTVTWEGATVNVTFNNDGTWQTNDITPPDVTTAVIAMEFRDYAGNVAKANENFFVSSNDPEFLRVTSIENDGSYKASVDKKIHLVLEFNKAVEFSGGGIPSLTLNVPTTGTKKTVNYDPDYKVDGKETNGTTSHVFTYTVENDEDISALDVTQINLNGAKYESTVNGTKFEVKDFKGKSTVAITGTKKLTVSKTLVIDTKPPLLTKLTAMTGKGAYNAGKEILIQGEFNEEVKLGNKEGTVAGDVSKIVLYFNTANTVKTTSVIKTGPKTVLFTYKIAAGQNFDKLEVNSVAVAGAGLMDIAENPITTPVTNNITSVGLTDIKVDTTPPATPVIQGTGFSDGAYIYNPAGASFTISGYETDASTKKYSVYGTTNSYSDYPGSAVSLTTNGDYTITAYQEDEAGNRSGDATPVHINIDTGGNILTSVSAGVPTGTYTTGKVIPIYLNFRKKVTIESGAELVLNNTKKALYSSGSGSTKAVFNYTVAEGDSSNGLNVDSISGTFKDEKGNNVNNYVVDIPSGKNLLDTRTIKIVTGKPVVTNVELSTQNGSDVLTITFSGAVSKGSGNIALEHGDGYKAPCVISADKFADYSLKSEDLSDYYTLGTNGSDASGNSDLTEKYVLNYGTETNDTTLIGYLKDADADKVIVSVNNSNVVASGSTLKVTFNDSYKIPVKGSSYKVKIDAGVVKDKQSHSNDATNTYTVTHSGLEAPVVRVNKRRETTGGTVTQPTTTGVKVDCQTPGASVSCKVYEQSNNQYSVTSKTSIPTQVAFSTTTSTTKNSFPFDIGNDGDTTKGYMYKLEATASKTGVASVTAYEFAYRSVYAMTNVGGGDVGTTGNYAQVWVRGSDLPSGGLSLSSFPVSWNSTQFDKVRAMTNSTGNTWYWISWEINKPAYLEPLRGDMPSDAETSGPSVWSWGMQCYIPGLANHPLYPGQSITFNGSTNYYGANALSFYNKHCEYRSGKTVVKKKKS